jgi:hypothetical protein
VNVSPVIERAVSAKQQGTWEPTVAGGKGSDLGFSAVRRSSDVGRARSGGGGSGGIASVEAFEATEADQIVGGADEIAREGGAVESSEAGPPEATVGLHPAEDLLTAMRGAFYAWVSTERQQHTQTIEQQVTQLRSSIATQDGWKVDEAHIGIGVPPPTPTWGNMLGGVLAESFRPP